MNWHELLRAYELLIFVCAVRAPGAGLKAARTAVVVRASPAVETGILRAAAAAFRAVVGVVNHAFVLAGILGDEVGAAGAAPGILQKKIAVTCKFHGIFTFIGVSRAFGA